VTAKVLIVRPPQTPEEGSFIAETPRARNYVSAYWWLHEENTTLRKVKVNLYLCLC